jgi:hypothetical protein
MKTFKGRESIPFLDQSCIEDLKKSFFPVDFAALLDALKELTFHILGGDQIKKDERNASSTVVGLLALCGWRALNSP